MKIGLNRITMPHLPLVEFMQQAKAMGFDAVEVRNDLIQKEILDNIDPKEVKKIGDELGLELITINALQRFNDHQKFLDQRYEELEDLVTLAKEAGIKAVVLVPVNDPDDKRSYEQRMKDSVAALDKFGPLFAKTKVQGLVEPLGFEICSLRYKSDAVKVINQSKFKSHYALVHDTFHHYLAKEDLFFPKETALVHLSGVSPGKEIEEISDADRILVTDDDVMGNIEQVAELLRLGYDGFASYECFSEEVQNFDLNTLKEKVKQSDKLLFS